MVAEDDVREMRREIERIKDRVDQIAHVQAQQVKAEGQVEEYILEYFAGARGRKRAQIFLAADGRRGVTEIAVLVNVGNATASRSLKRMEELGILGSFWKEGSKSYHQTALARELHLQRRIKKIADSS